MGSFRHNTFNNNRSGGGGNYRNGYNNHGKIRGDGGPPSSNGGAFSARIGFLEQVILVLLRKVDLKKVIDGDNALKQVLRDPIAVGIQVKSKELLLKEWIAKESGEESLARTLKVMMDSKPSTSIINPVVANAAVEAAANAAVNAAANVGLVAQQEQLVQRQRQLQEQERIFQEKIARVAPLAQQRRPLIMAVEELNIEPDNDNDSIMDGL